VSAVEINFDGLIGPSHNYAGLSWGNVASAKNKGGVARPRDAALQGLGKMRRVTGLGLTQGLLLPHPRPNLRALHALGFRGSPEHMMAACWTADPVLFANLFSASAMWTANAATISPSADTADGKLHATPANLSSNLHRSLEAPFTTAQLKLLFANAAHFIVHEPLPSGAHLGDEGAANHGRLCAAHGAAGVELFVYGDNRGGKFPARQDKRASEAIIRRHGLLHAQLVRQSNVAIDAGAFHNDVVSVANGRVLFTHQDAFADPDAAYAALRGAFPDLELIEVPRAAVPLEDAIRSYLFNSQLLTLPDGGMALVLPREVEETPSTAAYVQALPGLGTSIKAVHIIDVRESMRNGGGPACLRLRVAVTAPEHAALDPRFLLDEAKLQALEAVVSRSYPEAIAPDQLGDPALHRQCLDAWAAVLSSLGFAELLSWAE
jgi:succinylarginine dihydrolase